MDLFKVYLIFMVTLCIHHILIPNLKFEVSMLILVAFHGYRSYQYIKEMFDK